MIWTSSGKLHRNQAVYVLGGIRGVGKVECLRCNRDRNPWFLALRHRLVSRLSSAFSFHFQSDDHVFFHQRLITRVSHRKCHPPLPPHRSMKTLACKDSSLSTTADCVTSSMSCVSLLLSVNLTMRSCYHRLRDSHHAQRTTPTGGPLPAVGRSDNVDPCGTLSQCKL
jgi:hypothetical protein